MLGNVCGGEVDNLGSAQILRNALLLSVRGTNQQQAHGNKSKPVNETMKLGASHQAGNPTLAPQRPSVADEQLLREAHLELGQSICPSAAKVFKANCGVWLASTRSNHSLTFIDA